MSDPNAKSVRDESGATAIEYSLISALVAVGALVVLESLGFSLQKLFNWAAITLVIILLTGSLAFAGYWYVQRKESRCPWRRLSANDRAPFKCWNCRLCGEEAYAQGRWPPKECKSALRSAI